MLSDICISEARPEPPGKSSVPASSCLPTSGDRPAPGRPEGHGLRQPHHRLVYPLSGRQVVKKSRLQGRVV